MKTCSKCKTKKQESDFYPAKQGRSKTWCKECEKEYQRAIYANNPEAQRKRSEQWRTKYRDVFNLRRRENREAIYISELAKKHNVSKESVEQLIKVNGDRCMCCYRKFDKNNQHLRRNLDHCHKTGKIRGFLCSRCNHVLGLVEDDVDVLEQLTNYLIATQCITS